MAEEAELRVKLQKPSWFPAWTLQQRCAVCACIPPLVVGFFGLQEQRALNAELGAAGCAGNRADLITNYLPGRSTRWPHAKAACQLLFGGLGPHSKGHSWSETERSHKDNFKMQKFHMRQKLERNQSKTFVSLAQFQRF